MRRLTTLLLSFTLCIGSLMAQSRGDQLMKQAQNYLSKKEYAQARYNYLQAYNAFAKDKQYAKAVDAGVNVAALYSRERYYNEAFDMLGKVDRLLSDSGDQSAEITSLHYYPAKERFSTYVTLKNEGKANDCLNRMKSAAATNPLLDNDLLFNEATYYYSFNNPSAGDAVINKLLSRYENEKDYKKADTSFKQLIALATKSKNVQLVNRTYERYNEWSDSMRSLADASELNKVKKQLGDTESVVADKEHTIKVKSGIIVTLLVVIAVCGAVLVIGLILYFKRMATCNRLKKNLDIANNHNELKNKFIHNISDQMSPTLDTLDQSLPAVKALRGFSDHIQEMSDLESTLDSRYDVEEVNVAKFCDGIMAQIKPLAKPGMTLSVNAPKMVAKINKEAIEEVLLHLLRNAVEYAGEGGKVSLEFKKRGAKSMQFIVTDSGPGVAPEERENIFRPFTEVHDLTQGDALGLPICALKATKHGGKLTIDPDFTNGARFVLDLRS